MPPKFVRSGGRYGYDLDEPEQSESTRRLLGSTSDSDDEDTAYGHSRCVTVCVLLPSERLLGFEYAADGNLRHVDVLESHPHGGLPRRT